MAFYAAPLENLIERLCGLPGIGPKSAQRMAFFILSIPRDDAVELARAIVEVKDKVRFCSTCVNISEARRAPYATTPAGTRRSSAWWRSPAT